MQVTVLTNCINIRKVAEYIENERGSLLTLTGCWRPEQPCKPSSPTAPAALLMQALPLVLAWPVKHLLTWYFFAFILYHLRAGTGHLATEKQQGFAGCALLVLALIIAVLARSMMSPLLGLTTKWLIIGRARPGVYKLWGQYYLRWAASICSINAKFHIAVCSVCISC